MLSDPERHRPMVACGLREERLGGESSDSKQNRIDKRGDQDRYIYIGRF